MVVDAVEDVRELFSFVLWVGDLDYRRGLPFLGAGGAYNDILVQLFGKQRTYPGDDTDGHGSVVDRWMGPIRQCRDKRKEIKKKKKDSRGEKGKGKGSGWVRDGDGDRTTPEEDTFKHQKRRD